MKKWLKRLLTKKIKSATPATDVAIIMAIVFGIMGIAIGLLFR